jgi:hypothetical protein
MPDQTLAVAGLGRCGLTMTMQMLGAGGLDVWGDPPAYEPNHYVGAWSSDAVKLVDPIGNELSGLLPEPGALQWLWLARDAKEQAKSMAKMIEGTGRDVEWRRLLKTIRPSTRKHRRFIERRGEALRRVRFGNAVSSPAGYARHLNKRVVLDKDLNTDAMAEVVEDRSPDAESDLSRELSFL